MELCSQQWAPSPFRRGRPGVVPLLFLIQRLILWTSRWWCKKLFFGEDGGEGGEGGGKSLAMEAAACELMKFGHRTHSGHRLAYSVPGTLPG